MTIWFTADTHFGHANIIKYCNRPFANVQEMDEAMIANWNETVAPTDDVYHLGDFSFYRPPQTMAILERLNGIKRLITGNHDSRQSQRLRGWDYVVPINVPWPLTTSEGGTLWLAHYPTPPGEGGRSWQLCGHVHDSWLRRSDKVSGSVILNVGVDVHAFRPINEAQVLALLRT